MRPEITNFRRTDKERGKATQLATFSVNFGGVFEIHGFELIEVGNKTFVAAPERRYQDSNKEWKSFKYVFFHKGSGMKLLNAITELAMEEVDRRGTSRRRDEDEEDRPRRSAPRSRRRDDDDEEEERPRRKASTGSRKRFDEDDYDIGDGDDDLPF